MPGRVFIGTEKNAITALRITNGTETIDLLPRDGELIEFPVREYAVPWEPGSNYHAQIQTAATRDVWSPIDAGGFVKPVPEPALAVSLIAGLILLWVGKTRRERCKERRHYWRWPVWPWGWRAVQ